MPTPHPYPPVSEPVVRVPDASAPSSGDSLDATLAPVGELVSAAAAQETRHVSVFVGYEILGELGRGGMGVVYKARQRSLNRVVALKMVLTGMSASGKVAARFRGEAEAVARLQHPNIVQIYEVGEQVGRPYLSLEFVDGCTLAQKTGRTPQPTRPAAVLMETLARAVHFAHQRGIIHRDLKPANVLLATADAAGSSTLDPDALRAAALYGVPKISDFGLAKRLEDEVQHTHSGDILGTPSYMAPEQAAGKAAEVGPAADVYSLGAVLYELLTGRPPFTGATAIETLQQVLNADVVPPGRLRPKLPRDLERICLKCLEKDPRRRYASAQELADDLRRHLNGETVKARPAPVWERAWRWSRRNPVPASLLVAITLGSGFGFWHLSRLSRQLVRSSALEAAAQQTETMNELNRYYTRVATHLRDKAQIRGVHNWEADEDTMPAPATLTIELGEQITAKSESGMRVKLYSDFPFKNRLGRPPLDDFQAAALAALRDDPGRPHTEFTELDGRPVLRYATARRMEAGCVSCHNTHPGSTKRDWQVGDVRGVMEIVRPLDQDEGHIRRGLSGTVLMVGGTGVTLLGLSGMLLWAGNRGRRAALAGVTSGSGDAPAADPPREPTMSTTTAGGLPALPPGEGTQAETRVPPPPRAAPPPPSGAPLSLDGLPGGAEPARYRAALDAPRENPPDAITGP